MCRDGTPMRHPHCSCDAVDLNLGCPQRIAKKGHYGAFLMGEWELVESIVRTLAQGLKVPVTVKIRVYPEVEKTVAYAKMLERAGASVVAVHGRLREWKNNRDHRADWDKIRAVKQALRVPVIANGNIRHLADCFECMRYTGADAVMSAEGLLEDPGLFCQRRLEQGLVCPPVERAQLLLEYAQLLLQYPVHPRMTRGHIWGIMGDWLHEFVDLRDRVNRPGGMPPLELADLARDAEARIRRILAEEGRAHPVRALSERDIERMKKARGERRQAWVDKRVHLMASQHAGGGAPAGYCRGHEGGGRPRSPR